MRRPAHAGGVLTDVGEARRFARRAGDRWPLERALLHRPGGEEEYVVVLVSPGFHGMPWLERVYQAESLWDAAAMGAPAQVHCYTPPEFERKLRSMPTVRRAADGGIDLLGDGG